MRPELYGESRSAVLSRPRVIVASGMQGTGVSTIAELLQQSVSTIDVVDSGSRWADIWDACMPDFARMIAVTTSDIVSMSSTYALIKLIRDRFPLASIEVLVNCSETREALKTYERIQVAASHFLQETVGYAGAVPQAHRDVGDDHVGLMVGDDAVFAVQDLAARLDEELSVKDGTPTKRGVERRIIQ